MARSKGMRADSGISDMNPFLAVLVLAPWLPIFALVAIARSLAAVRALVLRPFRAKPFDAMAWNNEDAKARGGRYWMVHDLISKLHGKSREEVYRLLGNPDRGHQYTRDREDPHYLEGGRYQFRYHGYYLKPVWPVGCYELLICLNDHGKVK